MSRLLPHEQGERPVVEPSRMPVLRPPTPRANWRFTGLALGGLAVLAVLRLAVSHPSPAPSHLTPAAAVAGYLAATSRASESQLQSYLAPSVRDGAGPMLADLRRDRVRLVSPSIGVASQQGTTAQVEVALEICYRSSAKDPYTCDLLSHAPLGLPTEIGCQLINGRWYVNTLLEPQPLAPS